jgi:hypothetical protein
MLDKDDETVDMYEDEEDAVYEMVARNRAAAKQAQA